MKKLPEITYSDWMEALQVQEAIPDGWKTRRQIQDETGLARDTILEWVRRNPSKVEIHEFRVNFNGRMRLVPHYKLKPQSKNGKR